LILRQRDGVGAPEPGLRYPGLISTVVSLFLGD